MERGRGRTEGGGERGEQLGGLLAKLVSDHGQSGAAAELGVSERTIRRSVAAGKLTRGLRIALEKHLLMREGAGMPGSTSERRLDALEGWQTEQTQQLISLAGELQSARGAISELARDVAGRLGEMQETLSEVTVSSAGDSAAAGPGGEAVSGEGGPSACEGGRCAARWLRRWCCAQPRRRWLRRGGRGPRERVAEAEGAGGGGGDPSGSRNGGGGQAGAGDRAHTRARDGHTAGGAMGPGRQAPGGELAVGRAGRPETAEAKADCQTVGAANSHPRPVAALAFSKLSKRSGGSGAQTLAFARLFGNT